MVRPFRSFSPEGWGSWRYRQGTSQLYAPISASRCAQVLFFEAPPAQKPNPPGPAELFLSFNLVFFFESLYPALPTYNDILLVHSITICFCAPEITTLCTLARHLATPCQLCHPICIYPSRKPAPLSAVEPNQPDTSDPLAHLASSQE